MGGLFTKRMNKEIKEYQKDDFSFDNVIIRPSDDMRLWYFLIHGCIGTDYDDGKYLGKVMLPCDYPFKAPDFVFLTESGRFEVGRKICTSFSGFHNESYSPAWTIKTMCMGVLSLMTDSKEMTESQGIGGIFNLTKLEVSEITKRSSEKMLSNEIYKTYFEKYFD